jgi:hypothetical protein
MARDARDSTARQVLADANELAERLQSTLEFQIASVLKDRLILLIDPVLSLASVLILCFFAAYTQRFLKWDIDESKRILLGVLGQLMMQVIDDTLALYGAKANTAFLLRTCALCVPHVVGVINPTFLNNEYVQSSISVILYAYAQGSQKMLEGLDFGAPPLLIAVFAFVISHRSSSLIPHNLNLDMFQLVFRGWRMVLVNVILSSIQENTLGTTYWSQMAQSLALVLAVDVLGLSSQSVLSEVRGYAVYMTATHLVKLQSLSVDSVSATGICILLICTRTALVRLHASLHSGALILAAHSTGDVIFIACINVLLRTATDGRHTSVALDFLRVSVVCVMVYKLKYLMSRTDRSAP